MSKHTGYVGNQFQNQHFMLDHGCSQSGLKTSREMETKLSKSCWGGEGGRLPARDSKNS